LDDLWVGVVGGGSEDQGRGEHPWRRRRRRHPCADGFVVALGRGLLRGSGGRAGEPFTISKESPLFIDLGAVIEAVGPSGAPVTVTQR
jgi:hypothetical protein